MEKRGRKGGTSHFKPSVGQQDGSELGFQNMRKFNSSGEAENQDAAKKGDEKYNEV